MEKVQGFKGLDWLLDEIESSLKMAFEELEAFIGNPDDETRIRFCLGHLHQIWGPFKILECQGAILIAEELENVANGLLDKSINNQTEAVEVLVQSIIKLPLYLRQIRNYGEDRPEALILLLNDLHLVQGKPLVSEGAMFSPDLSSVKDLEAKPIATSDPEAFAVLVKKLRQMYQLSLMNVLKGHERNKNMQNMIRVADKLHQLTRESWQGSLWLTAHALLNAIATSRLELNLALKRLFRSLDGQIKALSADAATAPDLALLKNLLYYVVITKPVTEQETQVWQQFALERSTPRGTIDPDDARLVPKYDPAVIRSLVDALLIELGEVRDACEKYATEGDFASDELESAMPVLKRASDTLAVVGQGKIRASLITIWETLSKGLSNNGSVSHEILGEAMVRLADVESVLRSWSANPERYAGVIDIENFDLRHEVDMARSAMLTEARTGLEQIKERIIEFINGQWDRDLLQGVIEQIHEQQGALRVAGLAEAAEVMGACGKFVRAMVDNAERNPDWTEMDAFADAMTSVEVYMDQVLNRGVERADAQILRDTRDLLESRQDVVESDTAPLAAAESEPAPPVEQPTASVSSPFMDDDDDDVDDEIVDIFLEEARDVLSQLRDNFEVWQRNPDKLDALTDTRRNFHTLKGSGRMVGAGDLGEMAWSVENLLNRVLDGRIKPTGDVVDLVEVAIERVPVLIQAFADQGPDPEQDKTDQIRTTAERLAAGDRYVAPVADAVDTAPSVAGDEPQTEQTDSLDAALVPELSLDDVVESAPELLDPSSPDISADAEQIEQPVSNDAVELDYSRQEAAYSEPVNPEADNQQAGSEVEADHSESAASEESFSFDINFDAGTESAATETESSDSIEQSSDATTAADSFDFSADFAELSLEPGPEQADQAQEPADESAELSVDADLAAFEFSEESASADANQTADQSSDLSIESDTQEIELTLEPISQHSDAIELQSIELDSTESESLEPDAIDFEFADSVSSPDEAAEVDPSASDDLSSQWTPDGAAQSATELDVEALGQDAESTEAEAFDSESAIPTLDIEQGANADDDDDSEDELDQELLDIFVNESEVHLSTIDEYLRIVRVEAPFYQPPTSDLQRALHTLKGSASMAGLQDVTELVTPLEGFVKELHNHQVSVDDDIVQLIADGAEYVEIALHQIRTQQPLNNPYQELFFARISELRERSIGHILRMQENDEELKDLSALKNLMATGLYNLENPGPLIDLMVVSAEIRAENMPVLIGELNQTVDAASLAGVMEVANLAEAIQRCYESLQRENSFVDSNGAEVLKSAHEQLIDMFDLIAADQHLVPAPEAMVEALQALSLGDEEEPQANSAPDHVVAAATTSMAEIAAAMAEDDSEADSHELVDFSESSDATLAMLDDEVLGEEESDQQMSDAAAPALDDAVTESSFEMSVAEEPVLEDAVSEDAVSEDAVSEDAVSEDPVAEEAVAEDPVAEDAVAEQAVAEAPEPSVALLDEEIDSELVEIFVEEADELLQSIEPALHSWRDQGEAAEAIASLKRDLHTLKGSARMAGFRQMGDDAHDMETLIIAEDTGMSRDGIEQLFGYLDRLFGQFELAQRVMGGESVSAINAEIIAGAATAAAAPTAPASDDQAAPTEPEAEDFAPVGATADDQAEIGETTDEVEATPPEVESEAADHDIVEAVDALEREIDSTERAPGTADAEIAELSNVSSLLRPSAPDDTAAADGADHGEPMQPPAPAALSEVPLADADSPAPAMGQTQMREMVRVSADVLDNLVNLSGESIIFRGRVEEHISEFGSSLDEMEHTIRRLQDQVRRLGMETEAQVAFRQEQMEADMAENWDPLEMDRYSSIQQLSRAMLESASDLLDLKTTLLDRIHDSESLLLHQSRLNTDLQEGLMRTRMVPFSRIVPRLRRIVRQISLEVGKDVNLRLEDVEGEMDRTVLDRVVAPIEHMIRNSVDHGIESAEERRAAGKSEQGMIAITTQRSGGDILIRLADDGRGLPLDKIRARAIDKGMLQEGAELSDKELMQFIFEPGFSTAEKVTQISGRGVGMDVVNAEVRQLGGSVDINSIAGRGTEFVIRLPFTVSVNRALMIRTGSDNYALALNSIDGVHYVKPEQMEKFSQQGSIHYAGNDYEIRHLARMLNVSGSATALEMAMEAIPLVLFHSDNRRFAVQVSQIMGAQEIVVKSLGPQFSVVPGLQGATVLSDGQVVVILDLQALARSEATLELKRAVGGDGEVLEHLPSEPTGSAEEHIPIVMVVDDSVTVRKVTGRFLKRQGYRVMTAKDGVEALQILQDHVPDVMLLDIEMPRMDGFEVATRIKSSDRLKDIPIIMITSRTGEKHRERARNIGVERYLGKPYQEEALMEHVTEMLANKVS